MKAPDDYNAVATERCETALITLLGDIGPWSKKLFLVGGLVPRYLIPALPPDVPPHIGTSDVDLVVQVAVDDPDFETYRTLASNLQRAGFNQAQPSFQWRRELDGVAVAIEFLCDTEAVEAGRILRRPGEGVGTDFAALNVRGAGLVPRDFFEQELEGERIGGGISKVTLQVTALLPFVVLKLAAFQDRHEAKDVYDMIFCLLNWEGGPARAGEAAKRSPVAEETAVGETMAALTDRFATIDHDGPAEYGRFYESGGEDEVARRRQEAVAVVGAFVQAFRQE